MSSPSSSWCIRLIDSGDDFHVYVLVAWKALRSTKCLLANCSLHARQRLDELGLTHTSLAALQGDTWHATFFLERFQRSWPHCPSRAQLHRLFSRPEESL